MAAVPNQPVMSGVSRRELARNRWTWLATGGMTFFVALATAALARFGNVDAPLAPEIVAGLLACAGLVLLRSEPPSIDEVRNHLVIAIPWVACVAMFAAAPRGGGAAVAAGIFIGPLAAVRLQRPVPFAAHLGAATAALGLTALLTGPNVGTALAMLNMVLAMWVLGFSCWVMLGTAEAQGEELERLVRRDPLTGLGNRRMLVERLDDELARAARTERPLSILALDLNGFKALNDSLGHAEGDALLRGVADALARIAGPGDTVVRQGGDEFCFLLPGATPQMAVRTGNAVRAAVAGLEVAGISTGLGISSFPTDALDAATLMHVADERLRADKQASRAIRGTVVAAPAEAPQALLRPVATRPANGS